MTLIIPKEHVFQNGISWVYDHILVLFGNVARLNCHLQKQPFHIVIKVKINGS